MVTARLQSEPAQRFHQTLVRRVTSRRKNRETLTCSRIRIGAMIAYFIVQYELVTVSLLIIGHAPPCFFIIAAPARHHVFVTLMLAHRQSRSRA
jgi:hypothetical protein